MCYAIFIRFFFMNPTAVCYNGISSAININSA